MSTPKKTIKLCIERFAQVNGKSRDGAVLKFPLQCTAAEAKAIRQFAKGKGIYTVKVAV